MRTTPTSPLTLFSEPYIYLPSPELTSRDDKRHGFLRRLSNPLFSQRSLTEFEPTIKRYYKLFVDQIINEANENEGVINITRFIDHLAFDVGAYKRTLLTQQVGGALSLGDDFKALENIKTANEMVRLIGARWKWVANVRIPKYF